MVHRIVNRVAPWKTLAPDSTLAAERGAGDHHRLQHRHRPDADDLPGNEMAGPHRREQNLDDARCLLFDNAHQHPRAVLLQEDEQHQDAEKRGEPLARRGVARLDSADGDGRLERGHCGARRRSGLGDQALQSDGVGERGDQLGLLACISLVERPLEQDLVAAQHGDVDRAAPQPGRRCILCCHEYMELHLERRRQRLECTQGRRRRWINDGDVIGGCVTLARCGDGDRGDHDHGGDRGRDPERAGPEPLADLAPGDQQHRVHRATASRKTSDRRRRSKLK